MSQCTHIYQYIDRIRSYLVQLSRKRLVILSVVAAAFLIGATWAAVATYQSRIDSATDRALLAALWTSYKQHSWQDGRSFDAQNGGITTSEGQAYTMLRAVWCGDRTTFDTTWRWTAGHIERSDKLFSWQYGMRSDGTAGILIAAGGQNTASDADIDIATALLMAGARWHSAPYQAAAGQIIQSIWSEEVITVRGRPYLAADNIEKSAATRTFVVNPSYVAPYAFRLFHSFDPTHDWLGLANNSYTFLQHVDAAKLGVGSSSGLPPDWAVIDRTTGVIQASTNPGQTTNFGYNAFRTLWRVGLDWQWYHPPAALQTFQSYLPLQHDWTAHHTLAAVYTHAGQPTVAYESPALYGGSLGYFKVANDGIAANIVSSKIRPLYDPSRHNLTQPLSYYDNNWVWFGLALYENQLPNLVDSGGSS